METDRQYNEFLRRYSPKSGETVKKHKRPYRHSPNKPEARFEGTKPQMVLSEEVKARQEAYQLKRALRHGSGKFRKSHKG